MEPFDLRSIRPTRRTRPLLFGAFPDLAKTVPWMPLAHVPTPVERCDALSEWLGSNAGVFMKRDDLISPLYGGNKVRRYEFVLADAIAQAKKRIVTVGGLASTQAMATTLFGRALGFEVCVVLFDQPVTTFARESVQALAAAGAEIVYGGSYARTAVKTWGALRRGRNRERDGNYLVLPGAASPLANLGYIDAMLELARQVEQGEAPRPDVIVLPTGSSGTLAALALGAAHLGWSTKIIGVRITSAFVCNRATVSTIISSTDRFLASRDRRWKAVRDRVSYSLYGEALGAGYGHPTPEAIEGAHQMQSLTGASGEVTYSGKALAGLRAIARSPEYAGKTILLWNTLSTPRPRAPGAPVPPSLSWMFEGAAVA